TTPIPPGDRRGKTPGKALTSNSATATTTSIRAITFNTTGATVTSAKLASIQGSQPPTGPGHRSGSILTMTDAKTSSSPTASQNASTISTSSILSPTGRSSTK